MPPDSKNPEMIGLTDDEIDWLARGLVWLAEVKDWKRRCKLAGVFMKVGLFETEGWPYAIQRAAGIVPKGS